jgi:hypothetical protein
MFKLMWCILFHAQHHYVITVFGVPKTVCSKCDLAPNQEEDETVNYYD